MATLIMTAKLNDVDPLAWLADVLARIADIPQSQLHELLPWNCNTDAHGAGRVNSS
jgi:transposase